MGTKDDSKAAQERQQLGQVIQEVAHDLNNFLGALVATTEYLATLPKDATLDSPDVQECLRDNALATRRASRLVPRLLHVARACLEVDDEPAPRPDTGVVPSPPTSKRAAQRPGEGAQLPRLLFVDDDPSFGKATQRLLRRMGYEVEWVACGRDALASLSAADHDVILLDLDLPDMPGEQVLAELTRREPQLRVVILSGNVEGPRLQALRDRHPIVDVVTKPTSVMEIEKAVAAARPLAGAKRVPNSMVCGEDDDDGDDERTTADGDDDGDDEPSLCSGNQRGPAA